MTTPSTDLPTFDAGLTYLDAPSPRTEALHRLTLATAPTVDGPVYWIDSRSTASTYAVLEAPGGHRLADALRLARAFTAYQHHTLVQQVRHEADPAVLIVPCVDALYADDDVPDPQARALLADTLDALQALAADGTAVAVTAGTPAFADRVAGRADRTITARETAMGTAFEAEAFRTTVYRGPGFWQTTIPYWVELLGERAETAVDPALEPVQAALG